MVHKVWPQGHISITSFIVCRSWLVKKKINCLNWLSPLSRSSRWPPRPGSCGLLLPPVWRLCLVWPWSVTLGVDSNRRSTSSSSSSVVNWKCLLLAKGDFCLKQETFEGFIVVAGTCETPTTTAAATSTSSWTTTAAAAHYLPSKAICLQNLLMSSWKHH